MLCSDCVTDPSLSAWVQESGKEGTCAYCGEEGVCCDIEAIAERIDSAIREYYHLAPEEGHVSPDTDNIQYYAEGDSADEIVSEFVDAADAVTEIVAALAASEERDVRDGADALYDGSPLEHIDAYPHDFLDIWERFEHRLKHEVRFFDEEGRRLLDELFGDLPNLSGGHAIVSLAPDDGELKLYRARIIPDGSSAEEFVRDPARHIGPPSPRQARAGRMNPSGIPAFYGAFSQEVALAEIRPPVGALVAVGEFKLLRPLRLLDMSFLPFAYHEESIFSPNYDAVRSKLAFLEVFHRRISRPVLPSDEALAYLPTQAVAAYVANVLKLDGIIYSSTQVGAEGESVGEQLPRKLCNVVLFGQAAVVERTPSPPRPPESDPFDDGPLIPFIGLGKFAAKASEASAEASISGSTKDSVVPAADAPPSADAPLETKKSVIAEPDGFGENGVPATLRIRRDPQLVRIRAVKVETSWIFANLYEDGKVLIDYRDDEE